MKGLPTRNLTSLIEHVLIHDELGVPKTGLVFSDVSAALLRAGETPVSLTMEGVSVQGTYGAPTSSSHLRFVEVDASLFPGTYELQYPNEWLTGTPTTVTLCIQGSGLEQCVVQYWIEDRTFSVTLGQVQAPLEPSNRLDSPVALAMHQGASKTFTLTCASSLAGKTLRFVAYDENNAANSWFKVESPDITMGGADDKVALVTLSPAKSATANEDLLWNLWDVGNDESLKHGTLSITPSAKDHP